MISIVKTKDFSEIKSIRTAVFYELRLSEDELFDQDDNILDQFLIKNDDVSVGAFRLRAIGKSHKIERMGILPEFRSKGFGRMALEEIKILSRNLKISRLVLDAIYDVRDFYAKSGFIQESNAYPKAGIPHVKMYFEL